MPSIDDNSTQFFIQDDIQFLRNIKFSIFIVLLLPSLICNIVLVYYLIMDRALRRSLHHHAILILLLITLLTNFLEVPRIIDYLHTGIVRFQTKINCLIWQWCDYTFFNTVNILIFWISIQRHIFVFYANFYLRFKRRLFFHYLPLILILIYIILFYSFALFLYPCQQEFDFTQPLCGFPCYTSDPNTSLYDSIAHTWIPLFGQILFTISLVIRAVCRKRIGLQHQGSQWRRHRKMILQLLFISSLYTLCQFPFAGIIFIQLFTSLSTFALYLQINYFYYFFWLLTLLLPFVCMRSLPEVTNKFKNIFMRRNNTVTPVVRLAVKYGTNR